MDNIDNVAENEEHGGLPIHYLSGIKYNSVERRLSFVLFTDFNEFLFIIGLSNFRKDFSNLQLKHEQSKIPITFY
jgi:hypothetical protein